MNFSVPFWKEAPFIRIFLPFVIGIIIQDHTRNHVLISEVILVVSLCGLLFFSRAKLELKFEYSWFNGACIHLLLFSAGSILCSFKDPYLSRRDIEPFANSSSIYIVTLTEPPVERPGSWKALASLNALYNDHLKSFPETYVYLYFKKTGEPEIPGYGSRIICTAPLQKIDNIPAFGNFDYVRYCALKNIHFQSFISPGQFSILPGKNEKALSILIFSIRDWVIAVIRKYIPEAKERGLALALLIGYKNELDKDLIKSYSNTGVVHVIAISGLHLGLIYALLKFFCGPLQRKKYGKLFSAAIIIAGLWLFSLLAGASPSVLRSAVMFSCIVAGEAVSRKTSLLNNLSASAFFLLCYDPYWLWDLGFLLSYGALLSIVIFMKPIYQLIILKNKIADNIWKLNAVTISAQVLTMPILIYQFKQFPNLFLFTNFIAIPLSSIILFGEIILCAVFYFDGIAIITGKILAMLIRLMNNCVEFIDSIHFSATTGLEITFLQMILLYMIIALVAGWLLMKRKICLPFALISSILFFGIRGYKIWQ